MKYLKNFIMMLNNNLNKEIKKFITHDGSFHSDDIFAAAALSLMVEKDGFDFEIIRTRDEEIIKNGKEDEQYVFDVGGIYDAEKNRFDHHQSGGAGKRNGSLGEPGIEYASFGLVWKKFGEKICGSKEVAEVLDNKLVAPIDAWDNGRDLVENKHAISPYFIQHAMMAMQPTWREKDLTNEEMFSQSVTIARELLYREIIHVQDWILAREKVAAIYRNTVDKRIIVLDQNYPFEYILNNFPEPVFVIYFKESSNSWRVKSVREDPRTFKNRKDFPASWAGLKGEELQKVTGVSDAVFCHRGLFMVVAKTKEGAIKLAELALL